MFKKIILTTGIAFVFFLSNAQGLDTYVHEGEFGVSIGAGHYFGDLTTGMKIYNLKPKLAAGAYFQKQFNNYVGLKIGANYCFLGYADKYSSYINDRPKKFRNFLHEPNNPNSLPHPSVMTIASDQNDNLWIGTDGGGITKYNSVNETFEHLQLLFFYPFWCIV